VAALTEHVEVNDEHGRRRRRVVLTAARVDVAAELWPQLVDAHHAPCVRQPTVRRRWRLAARRRHDDVIVKPRDGRRRLGVATPAGHRHRLLSGADADDWVVGVALDVRISRGDCTVRHRPAAVISYATDNCMPFRLAKIRLLN